MAVSPLLGWWSGLKRRRFLEVSITFIYQPPLLFQIVQVRQLMSGRVARARRMSKNGRHTSHVFVLLLAPALAKPLKITDELRMETRLAPFATLKWSPKLMYGCVESSGCGGV
jgi:hypothetical protein